MDQQSDLVAAVDLGSNSFHLIVAQVADGGQIRVIDRLKEMVRLAEGLDDQNDLTERVMVRALDCLARFGHRLRALPQGAVRAVGTNTLRRARNGIEFLRRAEGALGHRIDIIAGREEARLIYLGVAHEMEDQGEGLRLVIDIGGGSTEVILGRRFQPEALESLFTGCVELSRRFFADGAISPERLRSAILAAHQEFETIQAGYRRLGWTTAIGASGSILAIHDVVTAAGWSRGGITLDALRRVGRAVGAAGRIKHLSLPGLSPERTPVFAGGLAILTAAFESLEIEFMQPSQGALREGLLYELLGRYHADDIRERTVDALMERVGVDREQAARVESTAAILLDACRDSWHLESEEWARILRWAARLHEIGLMVTHTQYHRHGGYLLRHMDLAGFARGEQQQLAALVRAHRRSFPEAEFADLREDTVEPVWRLAVVLRLAVGLHRCRGDLALPISLFTARAQTLTLNFPPGWLDEHPLTRADLAEEAGNLASVGYYLHYS
jgi:exopolyphosphatase/guanosine-5'-triphosphate,3'-diphosphate pyrophosphatase